MKQLKLTAQCCDIDQAKRLKELGVALEPVFAHVQLEYSTTIVMMKPEGYRLMKDYPVYPAYTVAELGYMIKRVQYVPFYNIAEKWQIFYHKRKESQRSTFPTEAQARAQQLIEMIEAGLINVNEL